MILQRLLRRSALCLALVLGTQTAQAATAWNESVSGDLANVGADATLLAVGLGSNLVMGASGNLGNGVDRDYFTFTVPMGWEWSSLMVLPGTEGAGAGAVLFIGLQAGHQVTVNPTSGSAAGLLGWDLFGAGNIGNDLLPSMAVASLGSSGFAPPLGAGHYAVWLQDTGSGTAPYRLDFVMTAVPEPAAAWLLLAGLAGWVGLGLRRR